MSGPKLRRLVLSQAVRENLDVIQGVRRLPARGGKRRALLWTSVGSAAGLGAALALAIGSGNWPAASRPESPPVAAPSAARPGAAVEAKQPRTAIALPKPGEVHREVFPLAVRRVVVDAGHGGTAEGAVARLTGRARLREKDLALDIARRLRTRLEAAGFEVLMTRDGDANLALRERAQFANDSQGDVFISIHLNWINGRRGVETYFLGATADASLNRLAAEENSESGYSMADLRSLLDGVFTQVRRDESRDLAQSVQAELFRALNAVSPGLADRGVKSAPFVVLISTEMPAVLAEVSCLSDPREVALLGDPRYRDRIAAALAEGIEGYARLAAQVGQKGG
jgi:N-acetylmuramoyl-L-alanine amidase